MHRRVFVTSNSARLVIRIASAKLIDTRPLGHKACRSLTYVALMPAQCKLKTAFGKRGLRDYDAGKKVNGRKCHLVVNTLELTRMVAV